MMGNMTAANEHGADAVTLEQRPVRAILVSSR